MDGGLVCNALNLLSSCSDITAGGFIVEPDWGASADSSGQKENVDDIPLIGGLESHQDPAGGQSSLDFSSTLSTGTLSLVSSWAKECATSHSKCHRIFGSDGLAQPEPWFPDRLIQVRRKANGALTARLVLKSNPTHFPPSDSKQLNYLSFSHCWGPPPDPSAPLGGRAGSVSPASWISGLQSPICSETFVFPPIMKLKK